MEFFRDAKRKIDEQIALKKADEKAALEKALAERQREEERARKQRHYEARFQALKPTVEEVFREANAVVLENKGKVSGWRVEVINGTLTSSDEDMDGHRWHCPARFKLHRIKLIVPGRGEVVAQTDIDIKIRKTNEGTYNTEPDKGNISMLGIRSNKGGVEYTRFSKDVDVSLDNDNEIIKQEVAKNTATLLIKLFERQ